MPEILHRRADGSFVIMLRGLPYHVVTEDPLCAQVRAAAEGMEFLPEPMPEPTPEQPQPTRAELMAQLEALRAKIEALPVEGAA